MDNLYRLQIKKPVFTITHTPIVVDCEETFSTYYSMVNYVTRIVKQLPVTAYVNFSSSDDPYLFNLNLIDHE